MNTHVSSALPDKTIEGTPEEISHEQWLDALLLVAKHYRLEYSRENIRLASAWSKDKPTLDVVRSLARQIGMTCRATGMDTKQLTPWRLPLVVLLDDGQVVVVEKIARDGELGVVFSHDQGLKSTMRTEELLQHAVLTLVIRPTRAATDTRIDDYIKPYEPNWFKKIVLNDLKPYGYVMLASLVANILGLAGILFSRQVYDRVIPAESLPTLYVLFSGVVIALLFDFVLRTTRVKITDLLGKVADIRISDRIFGHALRIKNSERPKSTGTFIAQIRELEQIRELLTSSTVTAFADLPFFLLFCFVLWYIAGPLALVPLCALLLLVVPGLLVQPRLRVLANEAMRESSLRNAMLVETVQGMEDIKSLQAEQRFQQQWNYFNAVTADVNLRLRFIANTLGVWTQVLQNVVFACVVLFGAPMVMAGDLSVGSMVAASILASRMMAPMSNFTQLMSRWQQAKVALSSLNQIMEREVDNPESERRVHKPFIRGEFQLNKVAFNYPGQKSAALQIKQLDIKPGERVAVLGRNGAGKSTLLQGLSGMLEPSDGEVLLDGVCLAHIDPGDVRRDTGLLTQNARLFHGTIRENLLLGSPDATDADIYDVLALTGAQEVVHKLPEGLDHVIQEGGLGLSGGQKQSLLLSRLLLKQPEVVLLDEPTASLDEATERRFIETLGRWLEGKTLVVATHRMPILSLADRIIVIDGGQIVLDDKKDRVLSLLAKKAGGPVTNIKT